jgi:hypothetical protein
MGSVRILLILVARRVVFFLNCRFHLYADDLQIYTVDGCGGVNRLVALVNGDLQRILDWSPLFPYS